MFSMHTLNECLLSALYMSDSIADTGHTTSAFFPMGEVRQQIKYKCMPGDNKGSKQQVNGGGAGYKDI